MTEMQLDESSAVEAARAEGFERARYRARQQLLIGLAVVVTLLGITAFAGYTFAQRAQEVAPVVIAEIAAERQAEFERRLLMRTAEAHQLTVKTFAFLENVWAKTEALHRIRSNVDGARQQLGLLSSEVNAAFDSPSDLGTLLENGPTRAKALVQHLLEVAKELQRFVPAVLKALQQAQDAAEAVDDDESSMTAVLASMDALLAPFLGTNIELQGQWSNLKTDLLDWMHRIDEDFATARQQLSGDALSDDFMKRLTDRVF